MSSHHIIKDNQEPALFLWEEIQEELLEELGSWSPQIYCHHSLISWVQKISLKIDFICAPAENKDQIEETLAYQMPFKFLELNKEGEIENILDSVNNTHIHFCSSDLTLLKSDPRIVLINNEFRAYMSKEHWQKWKPKDSKLEVIPNSALLSSKNLKNEKDQLIAIESALCRIDLKEEAIIKEYLKD